MSKDDLFEEQIVVKAQYKVGTSTSQADVSRQRLNPFLVKHVYLHDSALRKGEDEGLLAMCGVLIARYLTNTKALKISFLSTSHFQFTAFYR